MSYNDKNKRTIQEIVFPNTVNQIEAASFTGMTKLRELKMPEQITKVPSYALSLIHIFMIAENMGNIGFENFIHLALDYTEKDAKKLFYQANIQGSSVNTAYQYIVFHQCNEGYNARNERNTFLEAFQQSKLGKIGKIAFLDENDGLILLEAEKIHNSTPWTKDTTTELLKEFQRYIGLKFADMRLEFGICQEEKTLLEVRECVKKCQKVLKMGSIIFPEKDIWEYEMLGPLTWIEIPENELKEMLRKYRELMEEEKNIELLKTLKIYLENNMNYSCLLYTSRCV